MTKPASSGKWQAHAEAHRFAMMRNRLGTSWMLIHERERA